jgi:phytoene dehydrogenase-like protein
VNGRKGVWGHALGGMGAITQAMAAACAEQGVEVRLETPVAEVLTEKGRAVGAVTGAGDVVRARAVVSNLHPRLLFEQLVDDAVVPADFRERIGNYQSGSGTFRMNVALSELPDFTSLPGTGDHLTAGIIMAPSLAYMDRAHAEARLNGWSSKPIVEMLIPSTLDDSLAPAGQHVASLFCQHVDPTLGDEHRDTVADLMIETVDRYAPGFKASVVGRLALGPRDLERRFGLMGGDIFHGRLSLDQLFSARPVLGHADHRMPVPGLYLCGSGAHPGGGVTGAPGHNAARAVLKDLGR